LKSEAPKTTTNPLRDLIAAHQSVDEYQNLLWEGSFDDYLDTVRADPTKPLLDRSPE
jgi:hypothetical protein